MDKLDALVISDLHLTEHPNDEYRWEVFNQIRELQEEFKARDLFIMGDVTDKKDRHPAKLNNRIADELARMGNVFENVIILMGNHDYKTPNHPYLEYLNKLETGNIFWISKPTQLGRTLWLPHTHQPEEDWKDLDWNGVEYVFLHQPFFGFRTPQGMAIEQGCTREVFPSKAKLKKIKLWLSGDIHTAQDVRVGEITIKYVGTPYPIKFGDANEYNAIRLLGDKVKRIDLDNIAKLSVVITDVQDFQDLVAYEDNEGFLMPGDQISITVPLNQADASLFQAIRKDILDFCADYGLHVHNIKAEVQNKNKQTVKTDVEVEALDNSSVLDLYIETNGIDIHTASKGREILMDLA